MTNWINRIAAVAACLLAMDGAFGEENLLKNPGFEDCDSTVWKLGKYMTISFKPLEQTLLRLGLCGER